jgi:hypothetical protein
MTANRAISGQVGPTGNEGIDPVPGQGSKLGRHEGTNDCRPHLPEGGLIGDSDGPVWGSFMSALTVGLTLRLVRFGGSR